MQVIIDRFEENYAVCENDDLSIMHIEKNKIPSEAIEGDILVVEDDRIYVDVEATLKRRAEIEELYNS